MMRNLLENHFGRHYKSTKTVSAISEMRKGQLSLSDPKACADCKKYTPVKESDCDKVVANFDFDAHEVEVIMFEAFVDNFANLKAIPDGKKCDQLLVGEEKIVFCDMTCSRAKYIEPYQMQDGTSKVGKRNTVKKQIANSIALVHNVPEIARAIEEKTEKVALFAYREKPDQKRDVFDSGVMSKMNSFAKMTDKVMSEPMFSDIGYGFLFTEVKYPAIYKW